MCSIFLNVISLFLPVFPNYKILQLFLTLPSLKNYLHSSCDQILSQLLTPFKFSVHVPFDKIMKSFLFVFSLTPSSLFRKPLSFSVLAFSYRIYAFFVSHLRPLFSHLRLFSFCYRFLEFSILCFLFSFFSYHLHSLIDSFQFSPIFPSLFFSYSSISFFILSFSFSSSVSFSQCLFFASLIIGSTNRKVKTVGMYKFFCFGSRITFRVLTCFHDSWVKPCSYVSLFISTPLV